YRWDFERAVFMKLKDTHQGLSSKAILLVPDYQHGSLADLVTPIQHCRVVLSARYHGLLAASWAGCRVGGIARSSKIRSLSQDLGIPYIDRPVTLTNLRKLKNDAMPVPRERLLALEQRAIDGV